MSRTRLSAINSCLRGIGVAPIATEDDPDLDAAIAGIVLDDVNLDVQSRGWWFNKEEDWNITPNATTGKIEAPSNALSVVASGDSRGLNVTLRGGSVYDLTNHTYNLTDLAISKAGQTTKFITFTFIVEIPFNDLPPVAQRFIAYTARRLFAQDVEADEKRWKFQKKDEDDSQIAMLREDARNKHRNRLTGNSRTAAFIRKVAGQNSLFS